MRSGQQAALGRDLIGLLDGLGIETAIVAGFDWGGLASCVATALWPERVAGLVSLASYDAVDVDRLGHAFPPSLECAMWYQHLFQTERGRERLHRHRRDLCRMLWEQWSPGWRFDAARFDRTAASFDTRTSSTLSFTAIPSASDWPRAIRRFPSWSTGSGEPRSSFRR